MGDEKRFQLSQAELAVMSGQLAQAVARFPEGTRLEIVLNPLHYPELTSVFGYPVYHSPAVTYGEAIVQRQSAVHM